MLTAASSLTERLKTCTVPATASSCRSSASRPNHCVDGHARRAVSGCRWRGSWSCTTPPASLHVSRVTIPTPSPSRAWSATFLCPLLSARLSAALGPQEVPLRSRPCSPHVGRVARRQRGGLFSSGPERTETSENERFRGGLNRREATSLF